MTTSSLSKSLITTAFAAAMLTPAAMASDGMNFQSDTLRVDPIAVNMVSQSWVDLADSHARLASGDVTQARAKISEAIAKLSQAVRKDPTLGVSINGQTKPVQALHDDLKSLQSRISDPSAQQQLESMLESAGII